MIVAAGLTPAWQQILLFERLRFGEVNRAVRSVWCGSGKVLNVGASLHHLGANSITVCPIGGMTGQQIQVDFESRQIAARWIQTSERTRVCTTILDEANARSTELVENSAPLTESELDEYVSTFEDASRYADFVVFSGSLPQGTPVTFPRKLLERKNAKLVLDIRGPELRELLPLHPTLVKPNREELAATVGRTLDSDEDVVEAMSELRKLGAETVVVSNGAATLFVLEPNGLHRLQPPSVRAVNPIGCGDALTAAIAYQLHRDVSVLDAVQYAIAYAARKAASMMPVLSND